MKTAKSLVLFNVIFKSLAFISGVFFMLFFVYSSDRFPINNEVRGSELERVYVGGTFTGNFGYWDGSSWTVNNPGYGSILTVAVDNSSGIAYAGGLSDSGYFNGSSWTSWGIPMDVITVDQNTGNVYVSYRSAFTIGAETYNYIAMWDGSSWHHLGTGLNGRADSMFYDTGTNRLYAGGSFTTAGGSTANYFAYWDGSSWNTLGTSGFDQTVKGIDVDSSTGYVYVAGWFSNVDSTSVNGVAYWNGSSWNAMGSGIGTSCNTILVDEDDNVVYVGGSFAGELASWNGSSWTLYTAENFNSTVVSLVEGSTSGSLYVGGYFSGTPYPYLTYYNGSSWTQPTSLDNRVYAMAGYYPVSTTVSLSKGDTSISEDGGSTTFTATLSGTVGSDVTVNLAYSGTAVRNTDYTASSTSIVITAGNLTGSVTITGTDDSLYEGTETIVADIDSVTGASEDGTQTQSIDLTDTESPPEVALSTNSYSLDEDGGTVVVTATLDVESTLDTTVDLIFGGTATVTTDYTYTTDSLTITAGNTTGTVTLTGVNDSDIDPNETVLVDIDSVTNGTHDGQQELEITISDDEAPPTVTLSVDESTIAEDGGTSVVTATLSSSSTQDVTVNLAYTGTATNTSDYTRTGDSISITAGNTFGSVTLTSVDDGIDELDETIIVDISTVVGGVESGTQSETVTISDDETAPTVTLSINKSSTSENSGTATVTASLNRTSSRTVTANLAFSGSATKSTDYTASGTAINISAGNTTGSITITGIDDSIYEDTESIAIEISTVSNCVEYPAQSVSLDLTDNELYPVVTMSSNKTSISENSGQAILTFSLNNATTQNVAVLVGFSGTATKNTDYSRSTETVTISAGSTSKTSTVTAINDSSYEGNETIVVDILAINYASENGTQRKTITILDDDEEYIPPVEEDTTGDEMVEETTEEEVTENTAEPTEVTEEDTITVDGEEVTVADVVYEGEEIEFEEEDVEPVTEEDGIEVSVVLSEDTGDVKTTKKLSGSTLHVSNVKEVNISVPSSTLKAANTESDVDTVSVEIGEVSAEAVYDESKDTYSANIEIDTTGIKGTSTVTAKIVTKYDDGNTFTKGLHLVVQGVESSSSIIDIDLKYIFYSIILIMAILIGSFVIQKERERDNQGF